MLCRTRRGREIETGDRASGVSAPEGHLRAD